MIWINGRAMIFKASIFLKQQQQQHIAGLAICSISNEIKEPQS